MPPDLDILQTLRKHNVAFVIIGGHAVNFHGHLRLTEDIDVVWVRTPESELALSRALAEIGAEYIGKEIDPSTGIERTHPAGIAFIQANQLMMLCVGSGFLDLFSYVPGFPQTDVEEFYEASLESGDYRYASLDWLRKMKIASGRGKDLDDLKNLPQG